MDERQQANNAPPAITPPMPREFGMAELLCALSFAADNSLGERMEHGLRSAAVALRIARALDLPAAEHEAVYYGALLKDVGCTACGVGFSAFLPDDAQTPGLDMMLLDPTRIGDMLGWMLRQLPLDAQFPTRVARLTAFVAQCGPVIREQMRGHCEVGELFARRLGFPASVQLAVRYQLERWDGKGMGFGLAGAAIPVAARVLHAAQVVELVCSLKGLDAGRELASRQSGRRFDPAIAGVVAALFADRDFCAEMRSDLEPEALLALRPPTSADRTDEGREALLERVALAVADLVDVRAHAPYPHSREVAEVAAGIGRCLGLSGEEIARLRRAGLVHDLGTIAIPLNILEKGVRRSPAEREQYALHPAYTQRVLARVPAYADVVEAASSHHEWLDGSGFHRGLHGEQIPLHGRILAVADTYVVGSRSGDRSASVPADGLAAVRAHAGAHLDPACCEALERWLRGDAPARVPAPTPAMPGGLTEREGEVLRLLAHGLSNPQIAGMLVISRKTVEHHLDHIYGKIGVTCRTAAVAYALHHDLC
ncbi:MAG TPA: HD domain-containing phosphohydrolase [Ktedonobacterales bacterium]|nr:HD domain-containing phosphohydrolase [Ktedonobacterales bacterium]